MAHRPRGHVTLTGYSNRPEALSYFLSEMRTIRESKVLEPEEMDFSEIEEGIYIICKIISRNVLLFQELLQTPKTIRQFPQTCCAIL